MKTSALIATLFGVVAMAAPLAVQEKRDDAAFDTFLESKPRGPFRQSGPSNCHNTPEGVVCAWKRDAEDIATAPEPRSWVGPEHCHYDPQLEAEVCDEAKKRDAEDIAAAAPEPRRLVRAREPQFCRSVYEYDIVSEKFNQRVVCEPPEKRDVEPAPKATELLERRGGDDDLDCYYDEFGNPVFCE